MDNDVQAIAQLVRELYLAVSFERNKPPDWPALGRILWPKAQLVRAGLSGIEHYTLEQFMEWVETARANGLASFLEEETDASTHLMGQIAHRSSHYRATLDGGTIEGVNSIQMLKYDGQWKIISLLWDVPPP
ncbi:hypothetical protein ABS71_17245 [bacterium SCN 62-11]|nr:hypothetical protein [Candidatus Eremiobacteraeota bacterium]ODT60595.1 MAG: hypothetical protein ABS71_17245 [bacterium SCN 62-11]